MANKRLTVDQIDNFPIETLGSLKGADLRKVVADATRIANQRLRRIEKTGYDQVSPAYQSAVRKGHQRFTTRGKSDAALRNEFREARNFISMPTSTTKGFREVKSKLYKKIGIGGFSTPDKERDFWRTYHKVEELGISKNNYSQMIRDLYRITQERGGLEDMLVDINDQNSDKLEDLDPDEVDLLAQDHKMINDQGEIVDIGDTEDDYIYVTSQKALADYERSQEFSKLRRSDLFRSI